MDLVALVKAELGIASFKDFVGVSQFWTACFGVLIALFATGRITWVGYVMRREVPYLSRQFLYGVILTWLTIAAIFIRSATFRLWPEHYEAIRDHWSVMLIIAMGVLAGVVHFRLFTHSFAREWGWMGLLASTFLICYAAYPG